ncbi:hypothetical protein [Rathayibacter rathayi]|uniref:hypothetical protein n=1 Tax=Rathayibacter rathayi TaxID=33887 RepID=UPI0011B040DC|nr:hypothetical protein [Rathayibacter rathayi]
MVVRTDGSAVDWSYYNEAYAKFPGAPSEKASDQGFCEALPEFCISLNVIENPTRAAQVKSALAFPLVGARLRRRDAAFATGEVVLCALTGDIIAQKHQADTRHLDPTWEELTSRFVELHGGWDAIATHSGHGGIFVGRDVEDVALREA